MKTTKLLLAIACGSALLFTSCKKKETTTTTATYGKYTISGKVQYDQNTTTTGLENVSGATIIAEIDSYGLLDNPPTGTSPKTYFTTTAGSGTYSLPVDVGNKSIAIMVYPQDFEMDYVTSTSTTRRVWTSASFNATGIKGGMRVRDIMYN